MLHPSAGKESGKTEVSAPARTRNVAHVAKEKLSAKSSKLIVAHWGKAAMISDQGKEGSRLAARRKTRKKKKERRRPQPRRRSR